MKTKVQTMKLTREILEPIMLQAQQQRVKLRLRQNATWALLPDLIERLKQDLDDYGYDLSDSDNTPKKDDDEAGWEILQRYKQARYELKNNKPKTLEWLHPDGSIDQDQPTLEAILSGELDVAWLETDADNWAFNIEGNGRHILWRSFVNAYENLIEPGQ